MCRGETRPKAYRNLRMVVVEVLGCLAARGPQAHVRDRLRDAGLGVCEG